MSDAISLVDHLANVARLDTSIVRRAIVEGRIKVNGKIVDDPAFRLPAGEGFTVEIDDNKTPTTTKESA